MIVRNSAFWMRAINARGSKVTSVSPVNYDWRESKWLRVRAYPAELVRALCGTYFIPRTIMVIPNWVRPYRKRVGRQCK